MCKWCLFLHVRLLFFTFVCGWLVIAAHTAKLSWKQKKPLLIKCAETYSQAFTQICIAWDHWNEYIMYVESVLKYLTDT